MNHTRRGHQNRLHITGVACSDLVLTRTPPMQVLICLTLWTIWTFSSHAYHHCSSSSAGTLLTDGNLHQLIINVDTKRIKNYLGKWKVSLKLQTDINMKITNNTTIYIPKNPLHLFSARELCRSMDSNPCSLPITMTILEEENVEYFTNLLQQEPKMCHHIFIRWHNISNHGP